MSEQKQIGACIEWFHPNRKISGPEFADVDHWRQRLHEVCNDAIVAALQAGSSTVHIRILAKFVESHPSDCECYECWREMER